MARFFKNAPGQYGHGDVFLGISVPDLHGVARKHADLSLRAIASLLRSPLHEERLLSLLLDDDHDLSRPGSAPAWHR